MSAPPMYRITQPSDVGPILRGLRRQQGVTQLDVADAIGIRTSTNLCAIEHGNRMPDLTTLIGILQALGCELAVVAVRTAARRCVVEGCERKHHSGGLCQPHYARRWRSGALRPMVPIGAGRKGALKPRRSVGQ